MARPLRPAPAPQSTSTTSSSSTATPIPAPRHSSRPHRPSAALVAASAPLTPITPAPSTPSDAGRNKASAAIEAKTHGLRSVGVASERTPCPFPTSYGGREKCGISQEDEADEVLMSILGSIAFHDNRALSAEEIASTCFQQGWLRPPSAAIEPTTHINNSIRSYMKRCEKNKRPCLLAKYQLAGSVVESVLQPALHPTAFDSPIRPKGTVWYLCGGAGKTKWKSPFDGLEVPKLPARKPAPPKKPQPKESKAAKAEEKKSSCPKGKAKVPAPVKIRLVLNGPLLEGEDGSEIGSEVDVESSMRSQSRSVDPEPIGLALGQPISLPPQPKQPKRVKSRRPRDILDSSSESDTSDSDMEFDLPGPSRLVRQSRSYRKVPPPLPLGGSPRLSTSRLPQHSPFMDIFFPSPIVPLSPIPIPHASPFPSHSLDNTTWTARHDRTRHFETSSSSSDDDMREMAWGLDSDILIRPVEGDDDRPSWSMDEDEEKVKEATDALRVLFPMSTPDDDRDIDAKIKLNQLDNRPASLGDSPEKASCFGQLKALDAGGIALNAWIANSSPAVSPNLRTYRNLAPLDLSPTQHLSKLRSSFDPEEMEMEVDEKPWLDESGELPVKAEDSFSDVDLGSTIGDASTPEHDRHLHTALWAQEAAAIRIKQEPEDYPSPATTEDDHSPIGYNASRASSTPSSGLSELPPFDIEVDNGRMGVDEVILGPEGVSIDEELESWLPAQAKAERTPHRGRSTKNRNHPSRCSGNWGGIGVGIGVGAGFPAAKPPARTRSTRSNATATATSRRRRSSPCSPILDRSSPLTPEPDCMDEVDVEDAIGTDDLERARMEAEAREEQHRKECKAKEEQKRALLEVYRQAVQAEVLGHSEHVASPWSDGSGQPAWGTASTESLPANSPSSLSPLAFHSASTPTDGIHRMMAIDPKALVSPPIQAGFNWGPVPVNTSHPAPDMAMDMNLLNTVWSQREVEAIMSARSPASAPAPAPTSSPTPAVTTAPSPAPLAPPSAGPRFALPPPHIAPACVSLAPPPITVSASAPVSPAAQNSRPVSPASAPARVTPIAPKPSPIKVPIAPAPAQVAPAPPVPSVISHAAPAPKIILPTIAPKASSQPSPAPPITTTPPNEAVVPRPSPSPTPTTSSTSTPAPAPAPLVNAKPKAKAARAFRGLCEGVDACVIDHIPVYAHFFDGKPGQGKQVLLRRLDNDFVNVTVLLQALGVPETKRECDYLNKPLSAKFVAVRHTVKPLTNGTEYSPGVCGTWVHIHEAREFAKRAELREDSPLGNFMRLDLFSVFAAIAALSPKHEHGDNFGLPFKVGALDEPSSASSASSSSSNLSSANSKSAPNLVALSTSAPPTAHSHLRQSTAPVHPNLVNTCASAKGPLVRPAPTAPPEGCPQPKRRRATVSSPLAKKAGPGAGTTTGVNAPHIIAAAQSVPAAGTRMSIAAQKRATRASIGGGVLPKASMAK